MPEQLSIIDPRTQQKLVYDPKKRCPACNKRSDEVRHTNTSWPPHGPCPFDPEA